MSIEQYYAFCISLTMALFIICIGVVVSLYYKLQGYANDSDLLVLDSKVSLWIFAALTVMTFFWGLTSSRLGGIPDAFMGMKEHPVLQFALIFSILGPVIELFWTVIYDCVSALITSKKINFKLIGKTYLWMILIYGIGAWLFGLLYPYVSEQSWYARGLIYLLGIYSIEYISAKLLETGIGKIPWDYSDHTNYHFQGAIRLDYAPAWFLFGLAMEQMFIKLIS